jgi:dihydroorotase
MNRRELLRIVGAGSLPFLVHKWPQALAQAPAQSTSRKYELLLKGGRVVDPSQAFNSPADVAIAGGRIAAIQKDIDANQADRTVPVAGQIVTPGLIDLHTHGFAGISHWGVDLDQYCLARGTTTAIDAGTSGSDSFEGFRRLVIEPSRTRILAFLNISRVGLIGQPGELIDTRMIDVPSAVRVAKEHADVIVGIKVRCSENYSGPNDLVAVKAARTVADQIGKPLMIHVGNPHSPMDQILELARSGDIVTHAFRRAGGGGVVGPDGHVPEYIRRASKRGILFDVGHGSGSFSFTATEAALKENFPPTTISSDIHAYSALGPVFDLPTTMTKFLMHGLTLDKVIELTTVVPARLLKKTDEMGSLKPGSTADIAVFDLVQGNFTLVDSQNEIRKTTQKLVPVLTLRNGRIP